MTKRFQRSLQTLIKLEDEQIEAIRLTIRTIDEELDRTHERLEQTQLALKTEKTLAYADATLASTLQAYSEKTLSAIAMYEQAIQMLEHEREEQFDKLRANFMNQKAFEKLKEKMAYKAQQRADNRAQAMLDEIGLQKSLQKN